MIIYGVNPVLEAIRSHPDRIRYIAVAKDHGGKVQRVIGAAKSAGVAVRQMIIDIRALTDEGLARA